MALLWVPVGAACGSGYEAGTLLVEGPSTPSPRARRVGCLDVRVAAIGDPRADPSWAVLAFDFGNRCDRPVPLDLGQAVVTAAYADRAPGVLRPYDPDAEIGPGRIDGRATGREVIAWLGPQNLMEPPEWLCVDVAGLTTGGRVPPVCFDRLGEGSGARWRVR